MLISSSAIIALHRASPVLVALVFLFRWCASRRRRLDAGVRLGLVFGHGMVVVSTMFLRVDRHRGEDYEGWNDAKKHDPGGCTRTTKTGSPDVRPVRMWLARQFCHPLLRVPLRHEAPPALETETPLGHYRANVDPTHSPAADDEASLPLTPEAERALVDNHRRFLSFLERRLGTRAAAEEVLQTAFVRTIESGSAPRDGEGAVTWFYRLLRNALVDHYRKQAAEGRAVDRIAQESGAEQIDPELHEAICSCMHALLPALKSEYAQMVQKVDLEERPVGEVAAQLGVTANNASVRLHRARQALKRQLERACGSCATHGCLDCTCTSKSA